MSRPVVCYDDSTLTLTVNGVPFSYGFFEEINEVVHRSGHRPAWPLLVVERGLDERLSFEFVGPEDVAVLVAARNERASRA